MKSMLKQTTLREIKGSFSRFLAILAIVALGVGFFSGLKVTKPFMTATADQYIKEQNLFDLRLLSTWGFEQKDVDAFALEDGVKAAVGSYTYDILCTGIGENETVFRTHSLTEGINGVVLKAGRMPEKAGECVADSRLMGEAQLGSVVHLSQDNEADTKDVFSQQEFQVVGIVDACYYMNFERGTTSLGNGRITGFLYLPEETFDSEYFTEVFVKFDHAYKIHSEEYEEFMEEKTEEWEKITEGRTNVRFEEVLSDAEKELADREAEFKEKTAEGEAELADAEAELSDGKEQIDKGEKELADAKKILAEKKEQLAAQKQRLAMQEQQLAAQEQQFAMQEQQFVTQEQQLAAQEEGLAIQETLRQAEEELLKQEQELLKQERKLAEAKEEWEKGVWELADGKRELAEKTAEGEQELADARREIADLEKPESYVLDRNTNIGYVCFENDADIVAGIADIFPVFFFMVAALVCITTMNRMVEEQRGQIGVLKALGYTEAAIMSKYMFYAGSAAVLGCVAGYLGGTWLFPNVIWKAYGIMYSMPDLTFGFDGRLEVLSILVSLLCSMGATWLSCRYELLETAARLMRPKAPKAGKRVFLERIPFIWRRLKFLQKVSVRNIFRYKKRFFMMVIGISGCTALLVTGLGLKDSVAGLASQQYDEIQIFDGSISVKEDVAREEDGQFIETLRSLSDSYTFACEESWDLLYDGGVKSVNLVVLEEPEEIEKYLNFHTVKGEVLTYPEENQAVISHKIADMYHISVGDTITVRREDMQEMKAVVSGIFENFVYNYVYVTEGTYAEATGEKPEYRTVYVNYKEDLDIHESAAAFMKLDEVSVVSVNQDIMKRFDSMMSSMNYVVLLVIFSAGALAFIVLYNLTNINITERIREIATIKVLGFYRRETSAYVFRENLALTGVGALLGLVLGYFLHGFVMGRVQVDMVAFDVHIRPISYVLSVLLTFLFNFLVNRVMSLKLEKINMAESLKSVD